MRAFRRSLGTLCAAAALLGCADRELAYTGAVLRFVDRLDQAEIDVHAPLPVAGIVDEVHWVRGGLANVTISLRRADGVGGTAAGRVLLRWGLPLIPAPPEAGGADLPELIGVPLARIDQSESEDTANGFWLQGGQLGIVHVAGRELPGTFGLRYTIYAAQLAGTAEGAGFPPRETFAVHARRDSGSSEAVALPAGATLKTTLPPVGAGRLEGAFRALPSAGGRDGVVRIRLAVDGATVFDEEIQPGPLSFSLGTAAHPWVLLEASDESRAVELEVQGSPGGLALFEAPAWTRARSWKEDPNVLLVVVAGLRQDRLGCYDGVPGLTPELDELAGRSLLFQDAWSSSSWSLPSMATILTSTFASQHLATRHDRRLGRGVTTLAEVFREAGYRTAAFTDGGFVTPSFGLDRGFEAFDAQGGGAAAVCERASRFLDQQRDRPWFLMVHVADPLPPYEPPEKQRAAVALRHGEQVKRRPPDPAAYRELGLAGGAPADVTRYLRELYDEEVRETDRALGTLLDVLEEHGIFQDALIAVTSDHGQELGEHGFLGYGDTLYPEVLRVPLFLKLPRGQKAGLSVREPVSLIDLAPTILHGADQRERIAATTFAGTSLIQGVAPTPILASREHPVAGELHLLRSDRYLFVRGRTVYHQAPQVQLFDVVVDPLAQRDIARAQVPVAKVSASRIERHLLEHPPRVEGAENALSARERRALDPLPDARPAPAERIQEPEDASAPAEAGEPGRVRPRQPRKNR